jgi:hypothetical protein
VANCGAFVEDDAVCGFEYFNDGTRIVAGSFDDLDAFFYDNAGVGGIIWGNKSWEEGDIDTELRKKS